MKTEHVELHGFRIEIQRKQMRSMRLGVRSDGTVRLSVNPRVSRRSIEEFVLTNREWLARALEQQRKRQAPEEDLGHGGRVQFWGCWLEVRRREGVKAIATLEGEQVRIVAPDEDAAARAVARLRRREIEAAVEELAPDLETLIARHATGYRFREMRSRWGTCNVATGWITLNTWLAQRPPESLRYVLAHELAHLVEPGHGPAFQAVMDEIHPGWRPVRAQLQATLPPHR